jgi:hypothetical protein
MGREIKRVPLDFDWPIDEVWYGYLISYCVDDCKDCRKFAKIMKIKIDEEINCPKFPTYDPPNGDGFQMWETTSDGSPISPVFETPEELAKWLADTGTSSFGYKTESYETWLKFIKGPGWAPSMMSDGQKIVSGVKGMED